MSGSGRDSLLDVREWTTGPLECPEVVRRPSQMTGSDREALPGCLAVVGSPSRMSGSGGRPSRMSRSGRAGIPNDREWWGDPTGCS